MGQGALTWSTTIGDVLDDLEPRAEYRGVTLEQLLHHRGGLPPYTHGRPAGHDPAAVYEGTPTEQRTGFLHDVLQQDPVGTPGQTTLYSNAGYTIAGYMAERVTGKSWEQLVESLIFQPLGMTTAGFGIPDHPLGHAGNGPEFTSVPLSAYPKMQIIAPAGNVHCSVADLARYANAHLAGLAGRDGILRSETFKRLHTASRGSGEMRYASGWNLTTGANGQPIHSHGGTVGASYAEIKLYPATDSGVIVLTTVSQGIGEAIAGHLGRALPDRFRPQMDGFITTDTSAGKVSTGTEITAGESTSAEDAQVWRVVQRLSEAINNEDRAAYRALFAPNFNAANRDSMFDFMSRSVLPMRGGLRSFHALSAPLELPGKKLPLRAVTFHLQNGYPGYYGISLNDEGLLADFSLFVKGDICRSGTDRQCPLNAKVLGKDFK